MKTGLFFSLNGGLDSDTIDLAALQNHFQERYPVYVFQDFFNPASFDAILAEIKRGNFDGVLLVGDSPQYYQENKRAHYLLGKIAELGVNPNKIVIVNLREQLALVHDNREKATEKAQLLIEVAVARALFSEPVKTKIVAPQQSVAIFNAGTGAFLIAERLLSLGIRVYMVNSAEGAAQPEEQYYRSLRAVYSYVQLHPLATFINEASLSDLYGYAGDFTLTLITPGEEKELNVGSMVFSLSGDSTFPNQLRQFMHMDVDEHGRLIPLNADTLPVFTVEEGIFLMPEKASLADQSANADSTALAVSTLLEKKEIYHKILISEINAEQCGGCGTCVKTCMFKASSIDPIQKISVIDEKRCKGCGNCVTACPTGARDLLTYPKKYLTEAIKILSRFGSNGDIKILAFLCEGCGYKALDLAGAEGIKYPPNILPLGIRCGGNIDTQLLLEAYDEGFDGIVICKCTDGNCRNIVGDADLDRRANLFREILRSRGLNSDSLRIVEAFKNETNYCVQVMKGIYEEMVNERGGAGE